jgi:hypothetical protein
VGEPECVFHVLRTAVVIRNCALLWLPSSADGAVGQRGPFASLAGKSLFIEGKDPNPVIRGRMAGSLFAFKVSGTLK